LKSMTTTSTENAEFSPVDRKRAAWFSVAVLVLFSLALAAYACFVHMPLIDEGVWLYIARAWTRHGLAPYTGALENKTPGIFFVFAFCDLFFARPLLAARLLGAAAVAASGVLVWKIADSVSGRNAALWTATVYAALLLTYPTGPKYIAHTEAFMTAFSVLAFYIYMRGRENGGGSGTALLAGFAMGAAVLFKQVALTTTVALAAWPFLCREKSRGRKTGEAFLVVAGVFAVNALSLLLLVKCGTRPADYFEGAWLSLVRLLHVPGAAAATPSLRIEKAVRTWSDFVLFVLPVLVFFRRSDGWKIKREYLLLVTIWLVADFAGVNLSGEYFRHQFKQIAPSLALLTGAVVVNAEEIRKRFSSVEMEYAALLFAVVGLVLASKSLYVAYATETQPNLGMYAGELAREMTRPSDYVYICEDRASQAQLYTGRLSPTRYFNTIFVFGERQRGEIMADMDAKPPALILAHMETPPWLAGYMQSRGYAFLRRNFNYSFYYRTGEHGDVRNMRII